MTAIASPPQILAEATAIGGNPRAWQGLIAKHSRRVWVSLLASGASPDLADELVQETWTRLMQKVTAGQLARLELPGLAVRQAQFLYQDHLRKSSREKSLPAPEMDFEPTDPTAEAMLLKQERMNAARASIANCGESCQRVFEVLCEEPDAPHAEIGQRLGLSAQRVKQIVCEMRRALRALEASHGL